MRGTVLTLGPMLEDTTCDHCDEAMVVGSIGILFQGSVYCSMECVAAVAEELDALPGIDHTAAKDQAYAMLAQASGKRPDNFVFLGQDTDADDLESVVFCHPVFLARAIQLLTHQLMTEEPTVGPQ